MSEKSDRLSDRVALDAVLGALGIAFGAASLFFPFGRDQGRYAYIGREWLHGSLPYRDLFDDQMPGIYAVHAISVAVFGETTWGIRIFELVAIALVGILAATFAAPRVATPKRGARWAAVLFASVLYFGFQSFWDTAQPDLWCTTFGVAGVWAARRVSHRSGAAVVAGMLGGLAILFKPFAATFALCALVLCVLDANREPGGRARNLMLAVGRFVLGVAVPLAIATAYFAAHRALSSAIELLVDASGYVGRDNADFGIRKIAHAALAEYRYYAPVSVVIVGAVVIGLATAHRRGDAERRDRYLLALALLLAGFVAIVLQRRFYGCDWAMLVAPATVVAANAFADVSVWARGAPRFVRFGVVAFFAITWLASAGCRNWATATGAVLAYETGASDRQDFDRFFSIEDLGFFPGETERVAAWLASHSSATDLVCVRGFEPQIYVASHRRCGERFFWTTFLTGPTRIYRKRDWLNEDGAYLDRTKPRFVVAISAVDVGPDAPSIFVERGYIVVRVDPILTILEHRP